MAKDPDYFLERAHITPMMNLNFWNIKQILFIYTSLFRLVSP